MHSLNYEKPLFPFVGSRYMIEIQFSMKEKARKVDVWKITFSNQRNFTKCHIKLREIISWSIRAWLISLHFFLLIKTSFSLTSINFYLFLFHLLFIDLQTLSFCFWKLQLKQKVFTRDKSIPKRFMQGKTIRVSFFPW